MSILNIASSRSVYRGYDYFKDGNVISHKDYEDWLENDYEDEYEEYYEEDYYDEYEYDRYGNYNKYRSDFIRPIFFDELLSNFVNNLSEEKMRDILISELKKDEESTFNTYLQKDF